MRKFGGLGTGKSPMRQRPQPKTSMTSLASLAQMVGQSGEDDYSNIKLCLNSEKPQLELQESQQSYSKGWGNRNQSPLRRGLNKENDYSLYGNKNVFENNRFADCLIKEGPGGLIGGPPSHSPINGNLFPRSRQDVSPGRLRGNTNKLQEGDLVFRAGGNKGMNFSQISRKFNEQQHSSNDLLSYAPTLEESRPKSRTKAPRIQKKFDEDHFVDVKESIRQDEFSYKGTMNAGQRQRFQTKIEEIKEEKMKMLRNNQGNKTLLPKVIEEIKANATREIEEFAMYLFNQSKEQQENLLPPQPRIEERKVIIGAKQPALFSKPTEIPPPFKNNYQNNSEAWVQHPHMPLVQSQYPHEVNEFRSNIPKTTTSPPGFKLEPQPTRLVRGLELGNSKENTVIASIKEIGIEFSRKQDDIVQQLQRKNSQEQKIGRERQEEKERERLRQEDLMREMEAKRRRFEEEARVRQEEANRLEQQRIAREQKQRVEYEERIRREEDQRRQESERRRQEQLQYQRREEERLRVEQEQREREQYQRKVEEERIERQRRLYEENEIIRIRLERQRLEAEQRERQLERQRERERELERQREIERERQLQVLRIERQLKQAEERRLEAERVERQIREQEEANRIRLEIERAREESQRIERERIESQRLERERIQAQRWEAERQERQRLERERVRERLQRQRFEEERIQRETLERQRVQREQQLERQRIQEQRRQQQQRLRRQEQRLREEQRQRIQREQFQRQQRQRRQALEDQERRNRVLAELQEQRRREQARIQSQRLEREQRQRVERQKLASAPVNTSFKFDLGGGDLKTSFHFDNMFTNFSLGTPDITLGETQFTPSVTPPSTLDELTSNAVKQSININTSFKFDF